MCVLTVPSDRMGRVYIISTPWQYVKLDFGIFPFIRCEPWQLRGSPKMYPVGRQLRKVFDESEVDSGDFLRKFWTSCIELQDLSKPMVRKLLHFK